MSVFTEYLQEMKENEEKIKVYLKSKSSGKNGKVVSRMLSGTIISFDDDMLRIFGDEECIVARTEIMSIKADDGR